MLYITQLCASNLSAQYQHVSSSVTTRVDTYPAACQLPASDTDFWALEEIFAC